MVLFITTRGGYSDVQALVGTCPIWVAHGVLTRDEVTNLRQSGGDITIFTSPANYSDPNELADALNTIGEHHPSQRIWVGTGNP